MFAQVKVYAKQFNNPKYTSSKHNGPDNWPFSYEVTKVVNTTSVCVRQFLTKAEVDGLIEKKVLVTIE